jgi:hypothetical protein
MAELQPVIAGAPELVTWLLGSGEERDLVAKAAALRPCLIIVDGGDGTVQRVLTSLVRDDHEPMPPLALLPRGTTNMTAADCGLRRGDAASLRRLLEAARSGTLASHILRRRLLAVEGAADRAGVQRGFFFGMAGIVDAIRLCKQAVHRRGFAGEAASLLTLARLLGGWAMGRRPPGMLEGLEMAIELDGERRQGRELLALGTTLDRLVLRSRPFWNAASGPVRFTSICQPPQALLRQARRILWGGEDRGLPADCYFSRGARTVTIRTAGTFTIDGEMFEACPDRPLIVTAARELRLVRL